MDGSSKISGMTTTPTASAVLAQAPAPPELAAAHFAARLSFEADVSDVHADLAAEVPGLVVVDSRGVESWRQGHLPGAVHLPTAEIAARAAALIPADAVVVTYCWGPACNGATKAALEFARLGYRVKEMIGGYEYWVREGLTAESVTGPVSRPADDLTVPTGAAACDC
jgi:rhodanese-related sulfurtransferase